MSNANRRDGSRLRAAFIHVFLIGGSLVFVLLILELALMTGWFDGLDKPRPIWIPPKYKTLDLEIDYRNYEFAKEKPFRFTDQVRSLQKPPGSYRIAVLGDSFVWGDGIPYEQAWSHRLEQRIREGYQNVELLSWGRRGLQTDDELAFLKKYGIRYDIDFLIVGFVTNDPDMGGYSQRYLGWQNCSYLNYVKKLFPNAITFVSSYLNSFLYERVLADYGYRNWEDKLYADENLAKYAKLLQDFSAFCEENSIPLLFALTPNSYVPSFQEKYRKIIPLLEQAKIDFLNLYPAVVRDLGHYPLRQLWANPADGHPGELVHEVYAKEVFEYLQVNVLDTDARVCSMRSSDSAGDRMP